MRAKGKELEERLLREAEEEAERLKREAKAEAEAEGERMVLEAKKALDQHLPTVCAKLEAKNQKLLGRLLPELWQKILDEYLDQNDRAGRKEELLTLCDDFEAKNEKLLGRLLPELWEKITGHFESPDLLAFAMTCRFFREKQKDLKKKMETIVGGEDLVFYAHYWKVTSHSLGWFRWVCDTFKILPGYEWGERVEGAVYEGDLVNYAAF
eukprot:CAMPEP_0198474720 /NCGR_PEP_ID=MMETSP1456-20131121/40456_1 /TAXON_ID=1461544 ORGANISM="Unidentified sp., Strain RCC1871" /NCGR_SAMPLE_ID=MMETSP1456 /ASSEMBLY_ACC=CAM_ASM_001119 /LENGTH=209 /DNA_ID=CAMNT_0044201417 /DNA_START=54 /DNA_END=681 /DNA_ORIENTATION=-